MVTKEQHTSRFVNWNDPKVPVGKKKQSFIAWALKNGWALIDAQKEANARFGFERKGRELYIIGNAQYMNYPSYRQGRVTWPEMTCGRGWERRMESVVVIALYHSLHYGDSIRIWDLVDDTVKKPYESLPQDPESARAWAEKYGYEVIDTQLIL